MNPIPPRQLPFQRCVRRRAGWQRARFLRNADEGPVVRVLNNGGTHVFFVSDAQLECRTVRELDALAAEKIQGAEALKPLKPRKRSKRK